MESNVSYNVVRAKNRRERETQPTSFQENTAYSVNARNPTQTDEDTEYSTIDRGVGRNCRKGGLSLKGVKQLVSGTKCQKPLGAERRKFGGVTGSH